MFTSKNVKKFFKLSFHQIQFFPKPEGTQESVVLYTVRVAIALLVFLDNSEELVASASLSEGLFRVEMRGGNFRIGAFLQGVRFTMQITDCCCA